MSWKDISKSSYSIETGKFSIQQGRPFVLPRQGPKVVYNEGDELTSVADYRFNLDFTGVPLGDSHFPCGYWHKNYVPPFTVIYTSCLYPVEFGDGILSTGVGILDGYFNALIDHYGYANDYVIDTGVGISSGLFRSMVARVYPVESVNSISVSVSAGLFKKVVWRYSTIESIDSTAVGIVSGIFKDVVIEYNYWPAEGIEDLGILIVSGIHEN